MLGVGLHCAVFFSNSFVVWEDAIVRFLIATLLLAVAWLHLHEVIAISFPPVGYKRSMPKGVDE